MARRRAARAVSAAQADGPEEKSRAVLMRELSAAVRASQGGARATWRPGRAPDWWPEELLFSAPAALTAVELRDAVRASETSGAVAASAKLEWKAPLIKSEVMLPRAREGVRSDSDVDKENMSASANLYQNENDNEANGTSQANEKSTSQMQVDLDTGLVPRAKKSRSAEAKLSNSPSAKEQKTESTLVVTENPRQNVVAEDSSSRSTLLRELSAAVRASQGVSRVVWRSARTPDWWPKHVPFISASSLSTDQIRDALSGHANVQFDGASSPSSSEEEEEAPATDKSSAEAALNEDRCTSEPETMWHEEKKEQRTAERVTPTVDSDDRDINIPNVKVAAHLGSAAPLFDAMPPPPPKIMWSQPEVKQPNVDMDEFEQTIRAAISELELGVAQRKQRLKAMLRLKCDDVRASVQLTLQKLPKRVREMPVKDYVLEFGGDVHNFMIRALEDRVFAQLESTIQGTPEKSETYPSSTGTKKQESAFHAAAAGAATTARKRAAPTTQAPPYALRRSARTRGGGVTASTARAARGVQSTLFASTRGIVKATPARPARGGERILLFSADGSPLSPGAAGNVLLAATPGSGDDANEDVLRERLAAAEAEVARVKKVEKLIRRRLLNASRKGGKLPA
jgi:Nbl1 / Borealin N terminal